MAKNEPVPSWVLKPGQRDEEPPVVVAPPPKSDFLDTLSQYSGVATRALAPYTTAAVTGAAAGAPFAGAKDGAEGCVI